MRGCFSVLGLYTQTNVNILKLYFCLMYTTPIFCESTRTVCAFVRLF